MFLDRVTIDPKKFTLDLSQFQADFRRTFKPYPHPVPRGAFVVMGLVEVYGERAKITVSVHAVYDPKQGRYVGVSRLAARRGVGCAEDGLAGLLPMRGRAGGRKHAPGAQDGAPARLACGALEAGDRLGCSLG